MLNIRMTFSPGLIDSLLALYWPTSGGPGVRNRRPLLCHATLTHQTHSTINSNTPFERVSYAVAHRKLLQTNMSEVLNSYIVFWERCPFWKSTPWNMEWSALFRDTLRGLVQSRFCCFKRLHRNIKTRQSQDTFFKKMSMLQFYPEAVLSKGDGSHTLEWCREWTFTTFSSFLHVLLRDAAVFKIKRLRHGPATFHGHTVGSRWVGPF